MSTLFVNKIEEKDSGSKITLGNTLKVDAIEPKTNNGAIGISGVITPKTTSHAFVITEGSAAYTTAAGGTFLPFKKVVNSAGTGSTDFNTTTYKYVTPCKGIYHIQMHTITDSTTVASLWELNLNGVKQFNMVWKLDEKRASGSTSYYIDAGVSVGFSAGGGGARYYRHTGVFPSIDVYTYASFTLLQEIL